MVTKYERKYSDKYRNRSRELNWAKFQIKGMLASIVRLNTLLLLSDNKNKETDKSNTNFHCKIVIRDLQKDLKELSSIVESMRIIERHLDAHRNNGGDHA